MNSTSLAPQSRDLSGPRVPAHNRSLRATDGPAWARRLLNRRRAPRFCYCSCSCRSHVVRARPSEEASMSYLDRRISESDRAAFDRADP